MNFSIAYFKVLVYIRYTTRTITIRQNIPTSTKNNQPSTHKTQDMPKKNQNKNKASSSSNTTTESATTTQPQHGEDEMTISHQQEKNIRVIRYRFGGKRWEVPVFFNAYQSWLESEKLQQAQKNQHDENDDDDNDKNNTKSTSATTIPLTTLRKILITDRVFSNSYKRETARDTDIKKTFPGLSFDQVATKILQKGELVEIQKDRNQEQKQVAAAVHESMAFASRMIFHKFTGEVFDDETEVMNAMKKFAPTLKTLLSSSPLIVSNNNNSPSSSSSLYHLEPIWRCASWVAREVVLDSDISDEATLVAPVRFPIYYFYSSSKTSEEKVTEQQLATSFATMCALMETDFSGLVGMLPTKLEMIDNSKKNDDNEEEVEKQKEQENNQDQPIAKAECLIAGYMNPLSSSSSVTTSANHHHQLNFDWISAIEKSIYEQTSGSWRLATKDGKRIDTIKEPELLSWFLKDPFDLGQTICLPHYRQQQQQAEVLAAAKQSSSSFTTGSFDNHNDIDADSSAAKLPTTLKAKRKHKKNQQKKKKMMMGGDEGSSSGDDENDDKSDNSSSDDEGGNKKTVVDKYDAMTHRDLQQLCKKKGFSTGGKKADMISRLRAE